MNLALPGHLHAQAPIDAAGLSTAGPMGNGGRTPRPAISSIGTESVEATREVMRRSRTRGHIGRPAKIEGVVGQDIAGGSGRTRRAGRGCE